MRVLSINLSAVQDLFVPQGERLRRIATGIHKQPIAGPVEVKRLGLAGDEQADLTVHGGLRKAVYAYPSEHYPFWAAQRLAALKREDALPPGSVGENLTLEGLLEDEVWIGDRLHIGDTVLEVTEPRQPCFKFNAKMGFAHAARLMVQSGFTGFYLRVVREGTIAAGDPMRLEAGVRELTVARLNQQRLKGRQRDLF